MGLVSSLLVSVAVIATPLTAHAAEDDDTSAAKPVPSDIVVTGVQSGEGQAEVAQGGALGTRSLLDTPFSVTIVDRDDIDKRQATTIGQIFINDPSVFSFATAGTTNWWGTQIRGLGVRNYYIDDVPLLLYWGGDFPLESVERVEALKGLSGFMYGFGSPGGAISYRTKRPTPSPLLTTEIGWRSNSDVYGRLDAGGPLTQDGRLGYRLNLSGEKGNVYNGASVERFVGSLALEYAITPDVKWYATATYEDSTLRHEPFQIYWSAYQDTVLPKPTYDYDKLNIANSSYRTRTLATATGLDWQFAPQWSARLTYGYTSKLHHSNKMFVNLLDRTGDYEGYAYNFAEWDRNHFAQAMIQGEFRTGPVRHEIVAGASLMLNDADFGLNDGYHWGNDFNGNIYRDQPFRVTRDISWSTDGSPSRERQSAVFASDTLHLGEHIQAVLGARYTTYRLLDTDGNAATNSGYRTSAVTPTFALIYKPTAYASLYASYVEGMEPGSRVGATYANVGEVLKATVSKQYEAGVKYEHGGLSLAGAAFRIERAATIDRLTDGKRFLSQDGLTVYQGVEASAAYDVSRTLRVGLGAIHLDPRIRRVSPDNADLAGNIPGQAARWQVTANADYSFAAVPGLSVHGNFRYFGKAPTDDTDRLYIPGRTLANFGLQYATVIGGQNVLLTGNVNNLFDKKYWGLGNIGEGRNGALAVKIAW
ncbi:TonB-dependent siderophore receptor [Sphingomonas populi]|uniref:TonB-dependent siderophore receptor n=1 Tax=Sphingomonas populi TaxID=2484750 RepID=A0A4V2DD75_9SPHN|nr:TonB-dependent siderophore receptor [Sphingomonas populi]